MFDSKSKTWPQNDTDANPKVNWQNEDRNGKCYTYDPVIEEEQVIHHITSPKGISFGVAPNWFKNLSDHDYATPKEFKSAVDEIESKRPYTSLPIRY